jgi:hypothetical protein
MPSRFAVESGDKNKCAALAQLKTVEIHKNLQSTHVPCTISMKGKPLM